MKRKGLYTFEFLYRPGRRLDDARLDALVDELRSVAATCFDEVPYYQALKGTREELSDNVITVARRADGTMAGFCSAILIKVGRLKKVLHLGLTCVHPDARSHGLTHQLTSRLAVQYLLRRRPYGRVWISNVACVLSSLGNVALHFEDVYPSPFAMRPKRMHLQAAEAIDRHYREPIYINQDAIFDSDRFVFRGSVDQTMFQKDEEEQRFHHRNPDLNRYYRSIMDFKQGDEVLQVGRYSLLTGVKYMVKRRKSAPAGLPRELAPQPN